MSRLAPLPTVLPLFAAGIALLLARYQRAQRILSIAALVASLGMSVALLLAADDSGPLVARIGAWSTRIGISYVIDRFSGLMLVIAMLTLLVVLVFAMGEDSRKVESPIFYPVYLVLAAGVCAAFSTGDLFHLFVSFEILLMASYVLLTLDGNESQVRSATTYVIINTIESVVLLTAIGLVYASTGTLSMAALPERIAALDPGLQTGLQLLLLIAFGLKAAVFPLYFWLPDSYPTARSPVTAVFAGLLTKIGVYAIIRTQIDLFPHSDRGLLLTVAAITMVVGVLGAIAQNDMKRILSFHIVSQIGYMVFGIVIGGVAGVAATIFFLLHQIPIKTSLFLVEGMVEHSSGTSRLDRLSGLAHRSGFLAFLFLLPALSLAGIPPFSGFVAKLGLVTAGFDSGEGLVVVVAIVCSLLTLVSMTKIWLSVFWGSPAAASGGSPLSRRRPATSTPPEDAGAAASGGVATATVAPPAPPPPRLTWPAAMTAATVSLVAVGLAIALFAGPIYGLCERAAAELVAKVTRHLGGATVKSRLSYAVPLFVVLLVTWVLLQGELTVGNVVGGVVLAFALVVVFPISADAVHHELHPWGFVKFVVFVLYSLVMSSWAVIKIILRPTPTALRAGIVRVRLEQESPLTTTLVANAVTLTPGTMTLTATIHPAELHIHAVGLEDPDEFRAEIHDLERRTVEALTPVFPPGGDHHDADTDTGTGEGGLP